MCRSHPWRWCRSRRDSCCRWSGAAAAAVGATALATAGAVAEEPDARPAVSKSSLTPSKRLTVTVPTNDGLVLLTVLPLLLPLPPALPWLPAELSSLPPPHAARPMTPDAAIAASSMPREYQRPGLFPCIVFILSPVLISTANRSPGGRRQGREGIACRTTRHGVDWQFHRARPALRRACRIRPSVREGRPALPAR